MARYADACNVGGGFENVKRKDEILRRHCEEVGRDESEIERTVGMGVLRHPRRPGRGAARAARRPSRTTATREPWENQLVGTPEQVVETMRPFLGIGFRHFIIGFPSPYDAESMERHHDRGQADARRPR